MNADIRPARPEDYEALCAIYQQLDSLHREHLPDRFRQPDGPIRERDFLVGRITDPKVAFLVAEAEGNIIGFVQATVMDTPAIPTLRPRRYVYINEIVVQVEYRGQGIGRRLMAVAEEWAITQSATSIELGTYEFNSEAHGFYHRLGYTTLHRRMNKRL